MIKIKLVVLLLITVSVSAQQLPEELKNVYASKADMSVSDEFNAKRKNNKFNANKWHYRPATKWRTGLGTGQEFVEEKDGKLICYGLKDKRKAGGIISNKYFQYGFYAFKWKTTGMPANKRNAWHPSIWGSLGDSNKNTVPNTSGKGDSWMEIDIMEFSTWSKVSTDWSSDAPCYIWVDSLQKKVKVNRDEGPTFGWKKAIMIDGKKDAYKGKVMGKDGHGKWQTWGMEYHPEYLQMWLLDGDKWVKVGNLVKFSDNETMPSLRSVPKKAVKPLYWYIGNLYMPHGKTEIQEAQITNSTFEVDWFRFHPIKN